MTAIDSNNSTLQRTQKEDHNDDVIDLAAYADIIIRWWREIALFVILGALGAGGAVYVSEQFSTPTYQASATAIMARVTNDITLDERIQTLSERDVNIDAARRASLTGLVKSGSIAAAVMADLDGTLPSEMDTPAALLEHVSAEAVPSADSRTPSDLIRIVATAESPETAAAIANSWMRNYVEEVNALYGQVPIEVYDAVANERTRAEANFATAQKNLETFIGESRVQTLTRQIAEQQALVDFLRESQISAGMTSLARDTNLRIELFKRLSAAEIEPALALLDEQTRQNVQSIANLFGARTEASRHLRQAEALQNQISAGGDAAAASNLVALQLLKTQIFAGDATTASLAPPLNDSLANQAAPAATPQPTLSLMQPTSQQWSIDSASVPATAEEQLQDVAALVTSLERYIDRLDEEIAALEAGAEYQFLDQLAASRFTTTATGAEGELGDPSDTAAFDTLSLAILDSYRELFNVGGLTGVGADSIVALDDTELAVAITDAEENIQRLTAQLEAEKTRERQLIQQRDLAWNAYDTLSNKVVELNLERTAANREVRAGTLATAPLRPIAGSNPLFAATIGGIIGLLFGVFLAFLMNYLGRQPFLVRGQSTAAA